MTAGKHKGHRVLLTIDEDSYGRWKAHADSLGMPVATLMRQILEMSEPTAAIVFERINAFKDSGAPVDEVLGPVLVRLLLQMGKEEENGG